MKKLTLVLAIVILALSSTFAQSGAWKIDKNHSSVTFSVKHMVISEVTGQFQDFDVAVTSVKDDFTDAVVEGTIKVASVNTNSERRDAHLKTDDFFNAEKYPEIKFKSSSFEKVDEKNYRIHGDLTIRDVTRKVTFDAVYGGSLKSARGSMVAWKATIAINRFDYGLKWDRTIETGGLVAGDTVTITLSLEFRRQSS